MSKQSNISIGIMIVLGGFLFQTGLQAFFRPFAINGLYFQKWSSEQMMQTVPLIDLYNSPFETLFNIHIQPPGLDFIRAVLAHLWPDPDPNTLLLHVDGLMYVLWSILYALIGLLVFAWASKVTETKTAVAATVVFLLHPASIFYATMLDTTLLTSCLILFLYFLLWKVKNSQLVTLGALIAVLLALFFTRSIFELPFLLVMGISLFLLGLPARKVLLVMAITGSIVGLYLVKQYTQFGIFTTSSFSGFNLNRSIGKRNTDLVLQYLQTNTPQPGWDEGLPDVLTRTVKLSGTPNFNNIQYLELNQRLLGEYKERMLKKEFSRLYKPYVINLSIYFQPSSMYTEHVIVDRLPWRGLFDRVFSYPVLALLLVLCGVIWFAIPKSFADLVKGFGLALPGLFIFAVSVLFERGENNRFKFFMEPVIYMFMVSQLYYAGSQLYGLLKAKTSQKAQNPAG